MTPEPLKGKELKGYHSGTMKKSDIKSAVEGCLEETTLYLKEKGEWIRESEIKKIFKKWFEDVM